MDVNLKTNFEMKSGILPFEQRLRQESVNLKRHSLEVVQVNLGKLCNQSCQHCHVEAGPYRKEIMDRVMVENVIDFVKANQAKTTDITGGAPELNPSFRMLVKELSQTNRHVIVRSNLTVMAEPGMEDLPDFFREHRVEIVASLPCYTEENVDTQRGQGVYQKSIQVLRRLNGLGYGKEETGLHINLVYNPLGSFLPGPQADLERDYKRELSFRFGVSFNHLYTIVNINIGRFAKILQKLDEAEQYALLLGRSFNPATLGNLMCQRQVSISWEGYLYDCDFNQMLNMRLGNERAFRLGQAPANELAAQLIGQRILTGQHCYACTAGSGSSCTGALVG
jgi:radical SAM/Cys-rich protein